MTCGERPVSVFFLNNFGFSWNVIREGVRLGHLVSLSIIIVATIELPILFAIGRDPDVPLDF